ncbi:GFA family protein [Altererythrobacter sp. ZODW24]|uniref:GFA family protein n=1 Tax=Altererythrobacter sp. ZODW24 TaxID=2185142 RepID=UPI001F08862F|nr:GFA family protein [Altererythrobacter sp. ZODW24]
MMIEVSKTTEGGCTCGHVRYQILAKPLIVHCCHCRWCQRQTGSAFAINALVEARNVKLVSGDVEELMVDSPSGNGQNIVRCSICRVAVWSHYYMSGLKERIRFIRVGTLDNPDLMPPEVHIYTSTKQPWVLLANGANAVELFYDYDEIWSPESLDRRAALMEDAGIPVS